MAQSGQIVLAVGIDQRMDLGQTLVGLMVVDDYDVDPPSARHRKGFMAGGPAIHGYDQCCALLDQRLDRLGVGTIALRYAVRNIDARLDVVGRQKALEQGRGAGAIDVIIAKDCYPLMVEDGVGQPYRGLVHVAQRARIRHQCLDARLKHVGHLIEADPAPGQHTPKQLGQAIALADGDGAVARRGLEPLAPLQSAQRTLDAKKGALRAILARSDLANCPHRPHLAAATTLGGSHKRDSDSPLPSTVSCAWSSWPPAAVERTPCLNCGYRDNRRSSAAVRRPLKALPKRSARSHATQGCAGCGGLGPGRLCRHEALCQRAGVRVDRGMAAAAV